jgi:hypothetical protein
MPAEFALPRGHVDRRVAVEHLDRLGAIEISFPGGDHGLRMICGSTASESCGSNAFVFTAFYKPVAQGRRLFAQKLFPSRLGCSPPSRRDQP